MQLKQDSAEMVGTYGRMRAMLRLGGTLRKASGKGQSMSHLLPGGFQGKVFMNEPARVVGRPTA